VNPKLELNIPLLEQCAEEERAQKKEKFEALEIDKKIFSSNKQFAELLMARGFAVPQKTSVRTQRIIPALALGDTEFLNMLKGDDPVLRTLCEARVAAKSNLLRTGKWPFDVEYSGADQTHRYSGGGNGGGNPQNFTRCQDPKEHKKGHICKGKLRQAVVAPAGMALVVGDLAAIEMRLVAFLSADPGLIGAILNDIDIYCEFATAFYGRLITKNDDKERRFGKTAILGLGYNMGWKKFKLKVRTDTGQDITDDDAKRAVELYRTKYGNVPMLWHFLDKIIARMTKQGSGRPVGGLPVKYGFEHIELPSGLKLRYPGLRQEPGERGPQWVYDVYRKGKLEKSFLYGGKLLENICQALAGEICKEASLPVLHVQTGQVHDELHLLVKNFMAPIYKAKLRRLMAASPAWMPRAKFDAEVGFGSTWLGAK
jgi:hypothetical protein